MKGYDKNHAKFILTDLKARAEAAGVDWAGKHFIGLSGGKDSSACAAFAEFCELDYTAFICDTDHEKPVTVAYVNYLKHHLKGEVVTIQHEVTEVEFEAKREYMRAEWAKWVSPALRSKAKVELGVRQYWPPVPQHKLDLACQTLRPTGNAFLDILLLHGTMPQKKGKFCSLELKTQLAWEKIISPYLGEGHTGDDVIWWSGVRSEESKEREGLATYEPCGMDESGYVYNFRPVYTLKHFEVFQVLRYMGIPINPEYTAGAARVGCNECFVANKQAIRNSFSRHPASLDIISHWEREVAKVSRHAIQHKRTYVPFFREAYRLKQYGNWASAEQVFEWSKSKGMSKSPIEVHNSSCDSVYGLCD